MSTSEEPNPEPQPPAIPTPPFTTEVRDASMVQQWDVPSRIYRCYEAGALIVERAFTDAETASAAQAAADDVRRANRAVLLARVRIAVANNQTYLDKIASGLATNADHIAQVPALTRQMQGVIRLLVAGDLLDQT